MEVVWLYDERNAIPYVYDSAVPSKISFGVFERLVQDSKKGYLGYLLLLADKKEDIPKPFTFFACHNGDKLSVEKHKELLEFVRKRGHEKGWEKLVWLAENELKTI